MRSSGHAVAVDSFRYPTSSDRERTLVAANESVRAHSSVCPPTELLLLEGGVQEDAIAALEIQVSSPDSGVEVAHVALLRLVEASIIFLDRFIELLEELVSVPPIHGQPLPDSFMKGKGGGGRLRISSRGELPVLLRT